MRTALLLGTAAMLSMLTGCAGTMVEPGHRGLLFDPKNGGLQQEVLKPGYHRHSNCFMSSVCARVDDFDVTYSRKTEEIETHSLEGLPLHLKLTIVYRPIIAELYQLDTEIGPNYYDEVIGPEFRSASRGVFARHSYLELQKKNEPIENEVEAEVRRRASGRHVEISSVLLEAVTYAPEIEKAVRDRLVAAEETMRQKAAMENEAAKRKREMEIAAEHEKMHIEAEAAAAKMRIESDATKKELTTKSDIKVAEMKAESEAGLAKKKLELDVAQEKARIELNLSLQKGELELATKEAQVERIKAEADAAAKIATARGDATSRLALAKASFEEKRAEGASLTPLHVMMHAYDALGKLGGTGTLIMLGDWSKVPSFLFPKTPQFQMPYMPMPMMPAPVPTATSQAPSSSDDVFASTKH
jgi:regulator of protease activity HflC (stomatin/prohibitin superfamily)